MQDENEYLRKLIHRYLNNSLDAEEFDQLWRILNAFDKSEKVLTDELQSLWEESAGDTENITADRWNEQLKALLENNEETPESELSRKRKKIIAILYKSFVAAIILLLIGAGFYFFVEKKQQDDADYRIESKKITPGGNKAFLTLSNGKKVLLDSLSGGLVAQQAGVKVLNVSNGHIAYDKDKRSRDQPVYNTLNTPRGGQYELTLSDGTKVWLNAASSIKYPTVFSANKRIVELTGEAYFEVARDVSKPFEVKVGDVNVQVLGTHFNVMAYNDEAAIKTTLLKGAVQVTKGTAEVQLKPGQEAQVNGKGEIKLVPHADISAALAWKNNLFWFEDEDIAAIMRQIARWYDVDVEIRGEISQHFTGSMPRTADVSRVFEILKETGEINFKIKDHKIIVSP